MIKYQKIKVGNFEIATDLPFVIIAGPCQVESLDHSLFMADNLKKITDKVGINFIYKSSFDKANRTSISAGRGIGLDESLKIFESIKKQIGCPIVTDVHKEEHCEAVSEIVDILQIPAFLCRQTDLLAAAAKTGKIVKVKKGQFLAPHDMHNVFAKLKALGAKDILLTERGTCFGYNNLISDMRSLKIMAETGAPVIFDATHSVQKPGALKGTSGGDREFVETLARASIATGVAGIFMEVHQDPDNAPSDGPCMLRLDNFEHIVTLLKEYDKLNPLKKNVY